MYKTIILLFFLFAIQSNSYAESYLTHGLTKLEPKPIAELKLRDMDDEYIDIKSFKGKTIIVNFWATWCPPCLKEMPSLEKLHLQTKDKNVVVLAINIGEDVDTVFSFINSFDPPSTFPILFDTDASVMQQWKVLGLPTTYIVNPQGEMIYKAVGGREFDHPKIIEKILTIKF